MRLRRRHVVALSSGTSALELALLALGISPGDEVIVPALTFAAPAAAVRTIGALPVLADVTPETWTLDPQQVGYLLTVNTKAIIAVDVMGHPCDFDRLQEFGIPIVEDAAEAHGARYKGEPTGSHGLVSVFSFHANKAITTGEGGCIATDREDIADFVRVVANHGMRPDRPYWHNHVGRNARMTNLAAALGLAQVSRWDELLDSRNRLAEIYRAGLMDLGCEGRPEAEWASVSLWLQTVMLEKRHKVVSAMRQAGIDARAIWPALSDLPLYQSSVRRPCPVASQVAAGAAWLPTSTTMDESMVLEVLGQLSAARRV